MEKFTVEITEKHIKKGIRQHASSCPIALAIRGTKLRNVEVSDIIEFTKAGKKYQSSLSKRASRFIDKFDDGAKVKPFSFTVKPYQLDENGYPVEVTKKSTKAKTKAPVLSLDADALSDPGC